MAGVGESSRRIGVGVVGCGYWGMNIVRNIIESSRCRLVAACDRDPEKLKKVAQRYPSVVTTQEFGVLLDRADIAAVFVVTPISSHYPLANEALLAGKHVFVEKPLAASVQEAEKLAATASARNLTLMVGHTFEYSPPVRKVKEIIDMGHLGKIDFITTTRVNLGIHQSDSSVIWDLAPHDFSMLFYWLDEEPKTVSALGRGFVFSEIPDVAFVNLTFPSGAIANVQLSWLSPCKLRSTTIVGTERMLTYDDLDPLERVRVFDKGVSIKDPETFGEFQLTYRTGGITSPVLDNYEPLQEEVTHFADCILNGTPPMTDACSGIRVVRAIELAEMSLKRGGYPVENKALSQSRPTPKTPVDAR